MVIQFDCGGVNNISMTWAGKIIWFRLNIYLLDLMVKTKGMLFGSRRFFSIRCDWCAIFHDWQVGVFAELRGVMDP